MENSPYMDSITSARSILLTEQEQLEGGVTISVETVGDMTEESILTYIHDNFQQFLQTLRNLKPEDQELLTSYYLLSKTQNTLAPIHRSTQTVCSFRLRLAVRTLCAFMMMGRPTAAIMRPIFENMGLEDTLRGLPLSRGVELYSELHSFSRIAETYNLHRPDIRRAISRSSKILIQCPDSRSQALGAYMANLIDKANPSGMGMSKRQEQKMGNLVYSDPDILGAFDIDVTDEDFTNHMFVSRSTNS